ncbi:MAG: hypothetical protein IJL80_15055, partial [Treponema sp.]|nr:hypothetical protein [Treponema sp.]
MNNLYESEIKKLAVFLHDIIDVKKICDSKVLIAGSSGMIGKVFIDVLMELNRSDDLNVSVTALGRNEGNLKS